MNEQRGYQPMCPPGEAPNAPSPPTAVSGIQPPCCARDTNRDGNCDVHASPGVRRFDPTAASYDEDYYERGVESGKSCYTTYRWMPEFTIPLAARLCEIAGIQRGQRVLDFGCAKGFLVKALRLLGRDAWGVDASVYAIEHADPEVREFVQLISGGLCPAHDRVKVDCVIAKDVLEHIPYNQIDPLLASMALTASKIVVVVPLGVTDPMVRLRYVIEAYERDATHVIRESIEWWHQKIREHFPTMELSDYHVDGIKDNWFKVHPEGNAVFVASR